MTREQNDFITKLAEESGGMLLWLAHRYTGDAELAKDLFQETMLAACCKVEALQTHENIKGWLYKTLWNLSTCEMKKAYHGEVPLDSDIQGGASEIELPMEFYLPKGLKDSEREIILLRIDKELSYAEIAEQKGLAESACRQQLSRAVRKCRDLMMKSETGEENITPV